MNNIIENIHVKIEKNINFNRKDCYNLYNEIYSFLKYNELSKRLMSDFQNFINENKSLPNHVLYNFETNNFKKTTDPQIEARKREKRKAFLRNANKNYFIKDNRLYFKYKFNNKSLDKMIPYIYEINNIFYNAHISLKVHCTFKKAKNNLLEGSYYYEGITLDLKNYIQNCSRCQATRGLKPVKVPQSPIISNGPHDEYQMDFLVSTF